MRLKINIYICCGNLYLKLMNALCRGESLRELLISILPELRVRLCLRKNYKSQNALYLFARIPEG